MRLIDGKSLCDKCGVDIVQVNEGYEICAKGHSVPTTVSIAIKFNDIKTEKCWPAPQDKYLCPECNACKEAFIGPKHAFCCWECEQAREKQETPWMYATQEMFEAEASGSGVPFKAMNRLPKTDDRFISPCPPPTPYQNELLTILIEECAEVIQRATKMLRFGVAEVQPGQPETNLERLSGEIGDLECLIDLCKRNGLMSAMRVHDARNAKPAKLAKYMQHQPGDKK